MGLRYQPTKCTNPGDTILNSPGLGIGQPPPGFAGSLGGKDGVVRPVSERLVSNSFLIAALQSLIFVQREFRGHNT